MLRREFLVAAGLLIPGASALCALSDYPSRFVLKYTNANQSWLIARGKSTWYLDDGTLVVDFGSTLIESDIAGTHCSVYFDERLVRQIWIGSAAELEQGKSLTEKHYFNPEEIRERLGSSDYVLKGTL